MNTGVHDEGDAMTERMTYADERVAAERRELAALIRADMDEQRAWSTHIATGLGRALRIIEQRGLSAAPIDAPFEAIDRAEAEALAQHEAGTCHLSEWSCSHCEAESRG